MNTHAAAGQVFNLGGEEEISINDLAKRVIELAGSKSAIEHVSYEKAYGQQFDDMPRRVPKLDKIHDAIGFRPKQDLDGIITAWNPAAERLFGFTAPEAIGRSIRMIVPADRQGEEDDVLSRLRRGETIEHFETVRIRKDGTPINIALTVSPIKDAHGRVIGASKIARDIGERVQAEAERTRLFEAEQAARARAESAERRSTLLSESSAVLSSSLDYEGTLRSVANLAVPIMAVRRRPTIRRSSSSPPARPGSRRGWYTATRPRLRC